MHGNPVTSVDDLHSEMASSNSLATPKIIHFACMSAIMWNERKLQTGTEIVLAARWCHVVNQMSIGLQLMARHRFPFFSVIHVNGNETKMLTDLIQLTETVTEIRIKRILN
jgi:hypothetical protein